MFLDSGLPLGIICTYYILVYIYIYILNIYTLNSPVVPPKKTQKAKIHPPGQFFFNKNTVNLQSHRAVGPRQGFVVNLHNAGLGVRGRSRGVPAGEVGDGWRLLLPGVFLQ